MQRAGRRAAACAARRHPGTGRAELSDGAQAGITKWSYVVMGVIFAFSTPLGIAIGLGVQSTYNAHSPTALAVEGIFDSISAGAPWRTMAGAECVARLGDKAPQRAAASNL